MTSLTPLVSFLLFFPPIINNPSKKKSNTQTICEDNRYNIRDDDSNCDSIENESDDSYSDMEYNDYGSGSDT